MKKTLTLILILFAIIGYSQTIDLNKPNNYNTLNVDTLDVNKLKTDIITTDDSTEITFLGNINFDGQTITEVTYLDSITGNLANSTTPLDTIFSNSLQIGGLQSYFLYDTLIDDATVLLPILIFGNGTIVSMSGDTISASAYFEFGINGYTHLTSSVNTVNTDTDANELCIFDNGSGVAIRNRSGNTRIIKLKIWY